jgi:phage FluMu gp28-like protein
VTDRARELVPDTAGASVPAVLLPYQQRWIADPSDLKVMEKGRRTGITWAEAADDVLIAASAKDAGGQNVYYLGTDKEMTEEFIDACGMWAKAFNHAAGAMQEGFWDEDDEDKHIKTYTIRFPHSGHKITALASRPRKLRGRQGVLVGDEAAFVDDLPELIKAALAFLIWGGKVRIISTHDGADNAFNELVQEIRGGKRKGTVHKVTFLDAVKEGLYRRICLRLGRDWSQEAEESFVEDIYATYGEAAEEELDCVPKNSGGAYLSRALIESRMDPATPVLELALPDGFEMESRSVREGTVNEWLEKSALPHLQRLALMGSEIRTSCYGWDFARHVDLSVMVPLVEDHQLDRRPPFVVELRKVPFEQQKQILFFVADRLPRLRAGAHDATGNGMYLAEVAAQRYGSRIAQVMMSEKVYSEQCPKLKADLQDGTLYGLPKNGDWLDDLRAIQVVKGVPKVPALRTNAKGGGKRHGDAAVALMLANSIARADFSPLEFQSSGTAAAPRIADDYTGARTGFTDAGFGTVAGRNDFAGFGQ